MEDLTPEELLRVASEAAEAEYPVTPGLDRISVTVRQVLQEGYVKGFIAAWKASH